MFDKEYFSGSDDYSQASSAYRYQPPTLEQEIVYQVHGNGKLLVNLFSSLEFIYDFDKIASAFHTLYSQGKITMDSTYRVRKVYEEVLPTETELEKSKALLTRIQEVIHNL